MNKLDVEKIKAEINSLSGQDEIAVEKLKKLLIADMSFLTVSFCNKIIAKIAQEDLSKFTRFKIAFICNATIEPFDLYLKAEAFKYGLFLDVHIVDHYRYVEEIMNKESSLYDGDINLFIITLVGEELRPDLYFRFEELSSNEKKEAVAQTISTIKGLIENIKSFSKSPVILSNFAIPASSPYSILDYYCDEGQSATFYELNMKICKMTSIDRGIYYFDFNRIVNRFGKDNFRDAKRWYLAKQPFSTSFMPALAREYMRFLLPAIGKNKKCLILDLDNTLWGGIAGEDALENIDIGETPKGRAYVHLQREILSLYNRGIILAINSKNNPEDALKVFDEHPDMILRKKHFSAIKINWNDKTENIKAIAEDLNINTDSMVFIDDSPEEQELVRMKLPEVLVPHMPEDPANFVSVLKALPVFDSFTITKEDMDRGRLYSEESHRAQIKKSYTDISDFYRALEIKISIGRADKFTIPRISQLTMKTNQFNLSTRRYSPEEIAGLSSSEKHIVLWLQSEDKFGKSGIVAVSIIEKDGSAWFIDTFLMSCRVIGRTIEKAFLSHIVSLAKDEKVEEIRVDYIETSKNQPAKDFLKNSGFLKLHEDKGKFAWFQKVRNLNIEFPAWIKMITA